MEVARGFQPALAGAPLKKDWTLSQRAFDRLLARLDSDRDRAAERYEQVRSRLIAVFRWRHCLTPEQLADETIDRVSRRIDEGTEIVSEVPEAYFYGVARNVLKEYWTVEREECAALRTESIQGEPIGGVETGVEDHLQRLECLENCLNRLPAEVSGLIRQYYGWQGAAKASGRLELGRKLGLSAGALRIRAHRVRQSLEICVTKCLGNQSNG